jgi:hypothetical protein
VKIESIEDYHANSAISHSKLEVFRRRPRLFFKRYVEKSLPAPETTKAFTIGSAVHCSVLEPMTFERRFILGQKFDRRTKDGKAAAEAFEAANTGKTILDEESYQTVGKMRAAVMEHAVARTLIDNGNAELTWRVGGNPSLQCRTDCFSATGNQHSEGRPYIADIKTVESLDADSFRTFERASFAYGYHRQAGFYLPLVSEILNTPVFDFFFIAVEKVEPYGVAVYKLGNDAIATGQDETIMDLVRLKQCTERDEWPNIPEEIVPLDLPKWYKGGAS